MERSMTETLNPQNQQQPKAETFGLPPEALDFLRKQHIHFCLPMYGGLCNEATFIAMIKFGIIAGKMGLNYSIDTMVNESLVTRARNNLMAKMMTNTAATHFMFIDADIRFQPEAIFMMLATDKDVIGGLYPKKALPISYVINVKPGTMIQNDIFPVDTMGTGFMMFKRHVYEKLCAAHPETKYVDDVGLGKQFEPTMYAIFDCVIDERGHYLSEDWTFCYLWRMAGGKVFADTGIKLDHTGYHKYEGNVEELKKVLTNQISNGGPHHLDPQQPQQQQAAPQNAAPQPIKLKLNKNIDKQAVKKG